MVQIDEDIIRLIIKQNHIVLVGSVSADGIPNISPRYVLGILHNEKLLFADAFENKTFHNINAWPRVTVAVFDRDTQGGYQLKGSVETITDPQLISQAETRLREFGIQTKPKKVWALDVKEIFSLEPSPKSRYPWSYYS
ncbi:MAG TPA: pyridoxamine 5'-phosphate oxidase family protein [Nitrososphaera sp.]|nr:pyridoxamine 5'-phosphate oxidase family protein [Nitrososphaera sp.]